MLGELKIDNIDAYSEWGVGISNNGYTGLVCMPPLKAFQSNDWQEEDGIEADLSSPVLNTKEFSLNFYSDKGATGYFGFLEHLSNSGYHSFDCPAIGRSFTLRLVSSGKYDILSSLQTFTLKFADDFPLSGYSYQTPETPSIVMENEDYKFDGNSFTSYGVYINKGSLSEIYKPSNIKTALLRNVQTQGGAIYDGDAQPRWKAKDLKLICTMRADSLSKFWRNWNALLYDLTRAGAREFESVAADVVFPFCYKSCNVKNFDPEGKPWVDFELSLTNLSGTVERI